MTDIIFVSGFSIYTLGLISVLAFLWGSFIFFKKSVEAHFEEHMLFDVIVIGAFWSFIIGRLLFVILNVGTFWNNWLRIFLMVNYSGLNRWGIVLGCLLGAYFIVRKKKAKMFDVVDHITLGYLSGVSIFWVGLNFINYHWQNILLAGLYLTTFLILWRLESTYRLISWYRAAKTSAKTGFVAGFGLASVGLIYVVELITYKNVSITELFLGLAIFVVGLMVVYIRSGRLLVEDLNSLKIWNKKIKK